jgi:cytochrome c553
MSKITAGLLAGGAALALVCGSATRASATLDMQKKAKEAGFAAANCQYCHNEKLPKKGASTNNDRGKWLVAQKEAKKAKEIDLTWLKEYVEKK